MVPLKVDLWTLQCVCCHIVCSQKEHLVHISFISTRKTWTCFFDKFSCLGCVSVFSFIRTQQFTLISNIVSPLAVLSVLGLMALRPGIRLQSQTQERENMAKTWRMDCRFSNFQFFSRLFSRILLLRNNRVP